MCVSDDRYGMGVITHTYPVDNNQKQIRYENNDNNNSIGSNSWYCNTLYE